MAIFDGLKLEHVRSLSLDSNSVRACNSVREFIARAHEQFAFPSVALQPFSPADRGRTADLLRVATELLRDEAVSIYPVAHAAILSEFWLDPLRSKKDLRYIAASIWPVLIDRKLGDA